MIGTSWALWIGGLTPLENRGLPWVLGIWYIFTYIDNIYLYICIYCIVYLYIQNISMYRYINVTSKSSLPGLVGHGYTQRRHLLWGKFKQFLAVLNHYFYTPVLPFPYPDRNHVWNIHLHLLNSVANFWTNVSKYFIHHLGYWKSRCQKGSFSLFPISLVQPPQKKNSIRRRKLGPKMTRGSTDEFNPTRWSYCLGEEFDEQ